MWKIVILTLLWCNWSFSIQFLSTIQHWIIKIPCSKSLFVGVWYKEGKEDTTQNFWALSRFCVLSHSIYNMNCEALWQVLIKGTQQALNLVLSTFPPGVVILNHFFYYFWPTALWPRLMPNHLVLHCMAKITSCYKTHWHVCFKCHWFLSVATHYTKVQPFL